MPYYYRVSSPIWICGSKFCLKKIGMTWMTWNLEWLDWLAGFCGKRFFVQNRKGFMIVLFLPQPHATTKTEAGSLEAAETNPWGGRVFLDGWMVVGFFRGGGTEEPWKGSLFFHLPTNFSNPQPFFINPWRPLSSNYLSTGRTLKSTLLNL